MTQAQLALLKAIADYIIGDREEFDWRNTLAVDVWMAFDALNEDEDE